MKSTSYIIFVLPLIFLAVILSLMGFVASAPQPEITELTLGGPISEKPTQLKSAEEIRLSVVNGNMFCNPDSLSTRIVVDTEAREVFVRGPEEVLELLDFHGSCNGSLSICVNLDSVSLSADQKKRLANIHLADALTITVPATPRCVSTGDGFIDMTLQGLSVDYMEIKSGKGMKIEFVGCTVDSVDFILPSLTGMDAVLTNSSIADAAVSVATGAKMKLESENPRSVGSITVDSYKGVNDNTRNTSFLQISGLEGYRFVNRLTNPLQMTFSSPFRAEFSKLSGAVGLPENP